MVGRRAVATARRAATVATTDVALPAGDEPVVVTPWGDDLLVGSRAPEGSASRPAADRADGDRWSREVAGRPRCRRPRSRPSGSWRRPAGHASTSSAVHRPGRTRTPGGSPGAATRPGCASCRSRSPPSAAGGRGAGVAGADPERARSSSGRGRAVAPGSTSPCGTRRASAGCGPPRRARRWRARATDLVSARGRHRRPRRRARRRLGDPARRRQRHPAPGRVAVTRARRPVDAHRPARRGSLGEAHAAACDDTGRCTVVGRGRRDAARLGLAADGSVVGARRCPALAVGEHDLLPAPAARRRRGRRWCWPPAGGCACSRWAATASGQQTGPPARVVRSAARTATGDYVVLEDPAGAARLVRLAAP